MFVSIDSIIFLWLFISVISIIFQSLYIIFHSISMNAFFNNYKTIFSRSSHHLYFCRLKVTIWRATTVPCTTCVTIAYPRTSPVRSTSTGCWKEAVAMLSRAVAMLMPTLTSLAMKFTKQWMPTWQSTSRAWHKAEMEDLLLDIHWEDSFLATRLGSIHR